MALETSADAPASPQPSVGRGPEPTLGAYYYVQRADEEWYIAEIIQRRENTESRRLEFYVHYKECELVNIYCTIFQ